MKTILNIAVIAFACFLISGCSSSKNSTTLKPTNGHLAGTWTISDIALDIPSGFHVTDVFDVAPYEDFKGSKWNLVKNGKGSFSLTNGTKEDIYWSVYGKGNNAQFQFKKLDGMKARNVEDGYRLKLQNITNNSFSAISSVDLRNGNTGSITYTFTK
ncbi:MAG: hypothetical protein ABI288_11035 [Ginsengibacter sp.]